MIITKYKKMKGDIVMYMLPFFIVLISLRLVKKTSYKPYCIMIAIFCSMICSVLVGNMTFSQSVNILRLTAKSVLLENFSLFMTLFLFGCLLTFITESGTIEDMAEILSRIICSRLRFLALLVICALTAGVDDYLSCFLLTTVLGLCYQKLKLSKADVCFFINTIVVACCSMLPVSTWAPVIAEAISIENGSLSKHFLYLKYCFSYFVCFSIVVIIVMLFFKNKQDVNWKDNKIIAKTKIFEYIRIVPLLLACIVLYSTYILAHYSNISILNDNTLLISCISSLVFCHFVFGRKIKAKGYTIHKVYVNGTKDMWGLVKFLYILWVYTECLENMLYINETILYQVTQLNIPIMALPFTVFVFSGLISYCTGSVFATLKLLVPISLSLGIGLSVDEISLCLIATAAINGSLLASVSPLSDTMAICCDKMKQDDRLIFKEHFPYSSITICSAAASYFLAGYFLKSNLVLAVVMPIILVCPLIMLSIINIPYVYSIFRHGKTKILWLLSLYKIEDIRDIIWRYAKQDTRNICVFENRKYVSSKPIRNRPIYRLKLC